jgi:hypothetical protein
MSLKPLLIPQSPTQRQNYLDIYPHHVNCDKLATDEIEVHTLIGENIDADNVNAAHVVGTIVNTSIYTSVEGSAGDETVSDPSLFVTDFYNVHLRKVGATGTNYTLGNGTDNLAQEIIDAKDLKAGYSFETHVFNDVSSGNFEFTAAANSGFTIRGGHIADDATGFVKWFVNPGADGIEGFLYS